MNKAYGIDPVLSWDRLDSEINRSRASTITVLLIALLFAIAMTVLQAPEIKREQSESLPPRFAKLITKKKTLPKPPPPIIEQKKPEKKKEEKPKEVKPVEKPKKKAPIKVTEKKGEPKKPVSSIKEKTQEARQVAQKRAAVFDSLAGLRDMPSMSSLKAKPKAAVSTEGSQAKRTERNLITAAGTGKSNSGGVSVTRATSAPTQASRASAALAAAQSTAVASTIAETAVEPKQAAAEQKTSAAGKRTTEQIQLVFSRYKGAINSIYRRALRKNPSLQGTVVLSLTIEPDGTVSSCDVVSSELGDPALEAKIVNRIKLINFEPASVEPWKDTYSISFFPS